MAYYTIDYSKLPIITIAFSADEPSLPEFLQYLKELEDIYAKYDQFVLVMDATKSKFMSGDLRAKQSEWINKMKEQIQKKCKGMVFILPNVAVEILFKCIIAFSPLPTTYKTCRTIEDGMVEAEKLLNKAAA